jgi:hypothetical protein
MTKKRTNFVKICSEESCEKLVFYSINRGDSLNLIFSSRNSFEYYKYVTMKRNEEGIF